MKLPLLLFLLLIFWLSLIVLQDWGIRDSSTLLLGFLSGNGEIKNLFTIYLASPIRPESLFFSIMTKLSLLLSSPG